MCPPRACTDTPIAAWLSWRRVPRQRLSRSTRWSVAAKYHSRHPWSRPSTICGWEKQRGGSSAAFGMLSAMATPLADGLQIASPALNGAATGAMPRGIDNDWRTRPRQHLPANHLGLRSAFGAWRGARRSCRYGCDWRRGGRERRARRGPAPSACVVVVRVAILLVEEAVRIGGRCRVAIVPFARAATVGRSMRNR